MNFSKLALPFEYRIIGFVKQNDREWVAVEILDKNAAEFASYEVSKVGSGVNSPNGDGCFWGHYFNNHNEAVNDMLSRAGVKVVQ